MKNKNTHKIDENIQNRRGDVSFGDEFVSERITGVSEDDYYDILAQKARQENFLAVLWKTGSISRQR